MHVDYILVGLGLAGLAFAEELERNKKSYVVFEDHSQNSSLVAAGVYNPVILKRFTPVWDAENQLKIALPFYKALEKKLCISFDEPLEIFRVFTSVEEQNNWFSACDKPFFAKYMIPQIVQNTNSHIKAPFGLGKIVNTGKVDTAMLLNAYRKYLRAEQKIHFERFDYNALTIDDRAVSYKNITTKHVVFCEGYGVKKNPYFENVPLNEAKGELLIIYAPELKLNYLLKSSVFIMPLKDHHYKVGATFNWEDKSLAPTEGGKKELVTKLNKIINVDYKIVEHLAGIRPTVKDRRPILGKHPEYEQLGLLNGLGTRGVMLAPKMAGLLFEHFEHGTTLPKEVDIGRFK